MSIRGKRLTIVGKPLDDPVVAENTVGAWSCTKLKRGYQGPCMRVRRPSDDTEQDIGFVGGKVDLYALMTFIGTSYDQWENPRLTAPTPDTQPLLQNTEKGWTMYLDGTGFDNRKYFEMTNARHSTFWASSSTH
jgi:hypothetical protein